MSITPASIRNRNPGAQYPGASAKKFGSRSFEILRSKDGVHKIATFPTPIHGAAAQFDLLYRSYTGMTVEAAIKKWCGGYYASTYLKVLGDKVGLRPTDLLSKEALRDPAKAIPLAKAMAWQEAGREFPMDDADWAAAHEMAFGPAKAPAFDPGNDVPSPKPETRTAEAIKAAAPPVAAVGAGAGATVTALPSVPGPPDISVVSAWQAFGDTISASFTWVSSNPIIAGLCAAWVAVAWYSPTILRRLGWQS